MPTTPITTFSGQKLEPFMDPENARCMSVKLPASVNYPKGTILGEVTATPGTYKAYANANVDGSEVAKVVLVYDCQTDAAGLVTLSGTAAQAGDEHGGKMQSAPVYYSGTFKTEDLVQAGAGAIDAAAVTDLGRLVSGTIASGVIRIG